MVSVAKEHILIQTLSVYRVHTTLSLQKVITFYDYFSKKNYDFFMTSAIFLCRGLMFSNDVTH